MDLHNRRVQGDMMARDPAARSHGTGLSLQLAKFNHAMHGYRFNEGPKEEPKEGPKGEPNEVPILTSSFESGCAVQKSSGMNGNPSNGMLASNANALSRVSDRNAPNDESGASWIPKRSFSMAAESSWPQLG